MRTICGAIKMQFPTSAFLFVILPLCFGDELLRECPSQQVAHKVDAMTVCCQPVFNCEKGHEITYCTEDGGTDKCVPCADGYINDYITSSVDNTRHMCFFKTMSHRDCPMDDTFPTVDNESCTHMFCRCNFEDCRHGDVCGTCEKKSEGCGINQQLNDITGVCEPCGQFMYTKSKCGPCLYNETAWRANTDHANKQKEKEAPSISKVGLTNEQNKANWLMEGYKVMTALYKQIERCQKVSLTSTGSSMPSEKDVHCSIQGTTKGTKPVVTDVDVDSPRISEAAGNSGYIIATEDSTNSTEANMTDKKEDDFGMTPVIVVIVILVAVGICVALFLYLKKKLKRGDDSNKLVALYNSLFPNNRYQMRRNQEDTESPPHNGINHANGDPRVTQAVAPMVRQFEAAAAGTEEGATRVALLKDDTCNEEGEDTAEKQTAENNQS